MLAIMLQRIRTWLLRWLGVDGLEADCASLQRQINVLEGTVATLQTTMQVLTAALHKRAAQRFTPVTDYESSQIAAMAEFEEKKPNGVQV